MQELAKKEFQAQHERHNTRVNELQEHYQKENGQLTMQLRDLQ